MVNLLLILNNYFHDLAAALLFSSAALTFILLGQLKKRESPETVGFFLSALGKLNFIAIGSLVWVLVGGVIRAAAFKTVEWNTAVVKGIVPALILKHVLFFGAVVVGVFLWSRIRREAQTLRKRF